MRLPCKRVHAVAPLLLTVEMRFVPTTSAVSARLLLLPAMSVHASNTDHSSMVITRPGRATRSTFHIGAHTTARKPSQRGGQRERSRPLHTQYASRLQHSSSWFSIVA